MLSARGEADSQTVVACDNLIKIYKVPAADVEVVALQGLDLEVKRGELLAIIGQSGSGKTTLLNVLGAMDTPTAGSCTVAGYQLTRLSTRDAVEYRRFVVGHVWQQSGRNLIPDLSLEENVNLPQLLAGVGSTARRRRSRELLARVGLDDLRGKQPEQLSGGEQQRGAIAVALANEPALLLADEPTGELDSQTAHEVVALLHHLTRELGLTVILVTHDPVVAAAADRTIAIRDGRTSTETIRRLQPLTPEEREMAMAREDLESVHIGLPASTRHEPPTEPVVIGRSGWLQLPEEAMRRIAFAGRAELRLLRDHVELWPLDASHQASDPDRHSSRAESPDIGLSAAQYREAVIIDRNGHLQLPDEALARVPFGRHAEVRIVGDHVELWPGGLAASAHL